MIVTAKIRGEQIAADRQRLEQHVGLMLWDCLGYRSRRKNLHGYSFALMRDADGSFAIHPFAEVWASAPISQISYRSIYKMQEALSMFSIPSTCVGLFAILTTILGPQSSDGTQVSLETLSSIDAAPSPAIQLRSLYGLSRGFVNALQTVRISGRGWKIERESRKRFRELVDKCLEKREQRIAAVANNTEVEEDFWEEVIAEEVASELQLAEIIDEVLTPSEQAAYFVENARDLSGAVFYSQTFWRLAKLSEAQQNLIVKKLEQSLMLRVEMLSAAPSEVRAATRVNLLQGLTIKQLEVLFVLQARMDADMTMKEYLELASAREIKFLADANREIRELVQSMQGP